MLGPAVQQDYGIAAAGIRDVNPQARAHWASADAFQASITDPAFRAAARLPYPAHPALYRPVV